jgi:hypothetical protein
MMLFSWLANSLIAALLFSDRPSGFSDAVSGRGRRACHCVRRLRVLPGSRPSVVAGQHQARVARSVYAGRAEAGAAGKGGAFFADDLLPDWPFGFALVRLQVPRPMRRRRALPNRRGR